MRSKDGYGKECKGYKGKIYNGEELLQKARQEKQKLTNVIKDLKKESN